MNKEELIKAVAKETHFKKDTVRNILHGIIKVIVNSVAEGDNVVMVGFGTFKNVLRREREGRNPITGEKLT